MINDVVEVVEVEILKHEKGFSVLLNFFYKTNMRLVALSSTVCDVDGSK